jgi:hypothetical protein
VPELWNVKMSSRVPLGMESTKLHLHTDQWHIIQYLIYFLTIYFSLHRWTGSGWSPNIDWFIQMQSFSEPQPQKWDMTRSFYISKRRNIRGYNQMEHKRLKMTCIVYRVKPITTNYLNFICSYFFKKYFFPSNKTFSL